MRVAIVCPYRIDRPGGVQGQVLGLAGALRALGHHATVIAPGVVPGRADTGEGAGTGAGTGGVVGVGRSWPIPVNGSRASMAPTPTAVWRALRAVQRSAADVVHLHEPLAPSITLALAALHPLPTVATFHAAGDRTPYRWAAPLLRPVAARLDVRVAVSVAAADLARRHLGGVDAIVANCVPDGTAASRRPPGDARERAVLFLGRDEPRKGLDVLLDAVAFLPADVEVWVAGTTRSDRSRRGRSDDPRIRWLGSLDPAERDDRLGRAAVLCAPSLHGESFGMVLAEAIVAGATVVASDLPGYRETTGDGRAAVLVPPGDARALAQGLLAVLDDPARAARLRDAGTALRPPWSPAVMAGRYLALYEQARAVHGAAGSATPCGPRRR